MAAKSEPNCPFCKIVSGEYPSKKVYEDDKIMCVLDINPAAKGHCLIFPKDHHFIMPQLPPEIFRHLAYATFKMSKLVKEALFSTKSKIFIANGGAAGQQVGHFMIHIIPEKMHNFEINQKEPFNEETYNSLKQNINAMMHSHGQRNGKTMSSVETEHLYEFEDIKVKIPKKIAAKGHVEITGKRPVDFFYCCSYCASASFELLGAHGSNIIIDDSDSELIGHIIPRFSNDGLNFMWQPNKMEENTLFGIQKSINFKTLGVDFKEPEEKPVVNESTFFGNFIKDKLGRARV